MGEDAGTVPSIRGEAHGTVPPDGVTLSGRIRVSKSGRSPALAAAAAALERLTRDLAEAGGVPLRIDSHRAALSWSTFSATTEVEWRHDKRSGESTPTGRVFASVDVVLTVRDFGLLEPLGRLMTSHEAFDVNHVSWEVDDDNPEWAVVRSDAIAAALRKGRDYAAALGVEVAAVEHVVDTGLLGGAGDNARHYRMARRASAFSAGGGDGVGTPSLDPGPQELAAVIEARLRASAAAVPRWPPPAGNRSPERAQQASHSPIGYWDCDARPRQGVAGGVQIADAPHARSPALVSVPELLGGAAALGVASGRGYTTSARMLARDYASHRDRRR